MPGVLRLFALLVVASTVLSSCVPEDSGRFDGCGGVACLQCGAEGIRTGVCESDEACETVDDCAVSVSGTCTMSLGTSVSAYDRFACRDRRCTYLTRPHSCPDGTACTVCTDESRARACVAMPTPGECATCCGPIGDYGAGDPLIACACGRGDPCEDVCAESILCGGARRTSQDCASCLARAVTTGGACAESARFRADCLASDDAWCRDLAQCLSTCPSAPFYSPTQATVPPPTTLYCPIGGCCTSDSDVGTESFTITTLALASMYGRSIDGINNSPGPWGAGLTLPGCNAPDAAYGMDIALGTAAQHIAPDFDFDAALAAMLTPSGGSGAPLTVTLDHVGNFADLCVDVVLRLDTPELGVQTLHGTASLSSTSIYVAFADPLLLPLASSAGVPSSGCVSGTCVAASLRLTLRGLRLDLIFDTNRTAIRPGSILTGYIFVDDPAEEFAPIESTSWLTAVDSFATDAGLTPAFASELRTSFLDARDLHMVSDGRIRPCTGTTPDSLDANAVSFSFDVGGAAP